MTGTRAEKAVEGPVSEVSPALAYGPLCAPAAQPNHISPDLLKAYRSRTPAVVVATVTGMPTFRN